MKLTFEEEQVLKGINILDKRYVIEKVKSLETDDKNLNNLKNGLIVKLESCSQSEIEALLFKVD